MAGQGYQPQDADLYWELRIHLQLKGNYEVKEGQKSYEGRFFFETEWIGCLTEDEDDFLIYSIEGNLMNWEAQEKTKGFEEEKILTTKDFVNPPKLDFQYLLKEEDSIHFNFFVSGFDVPQSSSEFKKSLLLPATAEFTKANRTDDYSSRIVKGTNRVLLPLKTFFGERITVPFSWSWEDRRWTKEKGAIIFFSHSHDVKIKVTVIPHKTVPRQKEM